MYQVIKSTVVLAIFACASSFTTVSHATATPDVSIDAAKKFVNNLQVAQIPGTTNVLATWDGGANIGPWTVQVYDLGNFALVFSQVANTNSKVIPGLLTGHTYRVIVSDNTSAFKDITII